jgi:hypothetical protein
MVGVISMLDWFLQFWTYPVELIQIEILVNGLCGA